jgi:hypothetical protein
VTRNPLKRVNLPACQQGWCIYSQTVVDKLVTVDYTYNKDESCNGAGRKM